MPQQRFPKYKRPAATDLPAWHITDRDLDLIEIILRYRFSPASQLIRLASGNERVTQRRLQRLWLRHLVNRFAFPTLLGVGEFNYYLDSREALEVLQQQRRLEIHPQMLKELHTNREKDYAQAANRGKHMQLGFLRHWLMISRMHYMLEMTGRSSSGQIELTWHQGAELAGHKVELPRVSFHPGDKRWYRHEDTERLPVEPDGLFTLRFPHRPPEQQLVHFLYEADRGTMTPTDMKKKMRALWWFIKREQKHKEAFGVHPIRAVLIETTTEKRARALMEFADHPLVSGSKRTSLFWFTISPQFTGHTPEDEETGDTPLPRAAQAKYLQRPEIIFDPIWALPTRSAEYYTSPPHLQEKQELFPLSFSMHRLSDTENAEDLNSPMASGIVR